MRIRVLSDLHLEFCDWTPPSVQTDLVVLAGDIDNGVAGIRWARRHFKGPVIYVPGNHEYYGGQFDQVQIALREEARRADVLLLDGDAAYIEGTRFLGATLWTDFALYGSEAEQIGHAMDEARVYMTDYSEIRHADRAFEPVDTRRIHLTQVAWLERLIAEPCAGPTVVVTHFLPHRASIHPRYRSYRSNPFFASDLDYLVRPPVSLWIHGHTHESVCTVVNGTRLVCNPRGLIPVEPNENFDPTFAAEV